MVYDAVIIGAGHNGLAAGIYLAKAGWSVLIAERNEEPGGAIRSGEITEPGAVHDLYSTNQNLFLGSPVFAELGEDLARHGLSFAHSGKPYCNVFPDGSSLRVYSDVSKTREMFEAHNPEDLQGFMALYDAFKTFRETMLPIYAQKMPSTDVGRTLTQAVATYGLETMLRLGKLAAKSTREVGDTFFATPEAKALVATWGLHLDFGPDITMGALFPMLESYTDMQEGMNIVEGGASNLTGAMVGLFEEYGGELRTGAEVARVEVADGKATGVTLAGGETVHANKAVIANVTPPVLFGSLVPAQHIPPAFQQKVENFTYGPGTMMVHLLLDGKPQWAAGEDVDEFAYVHIAPYIEDLSMMYTQAVNGLIPESPLLIVGQTTAVDPSRTPDDREILWIQVRVLPGEIKGDAAGEIKATDWAEAAEPVAERVLDKLERYAPGIREQIVGQAVVSPADLEAHNPNLVDGDSISGSHHLSQFLLLRPFVGYSTYNTPIDGLHMVGASTWPGAGNNATSGYLAAQDLITATPLETLHSLLGG